MWFAREKHLPYILELVLGSSSKCYAATLLCIGDGNSLAQAFASTSNQDPFTLQ